MYKSMSRQDLENLLNDLDGDIARLRADYPDREEFWEAFNGLTEVGIERAEPRDQVWFQEQIQRLIERHGLNRPETWTPHS
jgi:hypothetical protein